MEAPRRLAHIANNTSRRRLLAQPESKPAGIEVKEVANTLYKDIVIMTEFIETDYEALTVPEPRTLRKFVYYKQEVLLDGTLTNARQVILKTAEVVGMLKKIPNVPLQCHGQNYIMAVYTMHQYLIQLVVDCKEPSKQKLLEMQRGLAVLHECALAFVRELESYFHQSQVRKQ
jgi:hypothetical protein